MSTVICNSWGLQNKDSGAYLVSLSVTIWLSRLDLDLDLIALLVKQQQQSGVVLWAHSVGINALTLLRRHPGLEGMFVGVAHVMRQQRILILEGAGESGELR